MDPAVLIALQSAITPEWFPPACAQPATPGYALVSVHDTPRKDAIPTDAVVLIDPDGAIWAREENLSTWLRHPLAGSAREQDGARWHDLRGTDLPYRFDPCAQSLWISPVRDPQQLTFGGFIPGTLTPAQFGGFINFDLFAARSEDTGTESAGLSDLGLAKDFASLRSAWVHDREGTRRLDSFLSVDDPERLHRLRLGDGVTRTDLLGTAVRYGGIRWGTEFSLQPEVPRFALPTLSGQAALPSTVELYVDGQLRDRREVDPGPFAVTNPPIFTGGGNLQVVVRDALGRETLYAQRFYVSNQSLAAGVRDYSIELGRLRENFASADDRYRDEFALGSYRYGFSDRLTAGARLELQEAAQTLGGSALLTQPGIGQFSSSLALSDGDAGSGAQLGLGYERTARALSFGVQGSWSEPQYVELGRAPGAVARSLRAQAGAPLPFGASVSLGWAEEIRRDREDLELTALTFTQPLFGWYGSLSWLTSPQTGDSAVLGLSKALAGGQTLSLQLQRDPNDEALFTLTWQRSPRGPLGWYSLAGVTGGDRDATTVSLGYSHERGNARVTSLESDGTRTTQAELNTGFAWLDHDVYWTRPIRDSFVVADAAAPGVRVYRDNQLVGTTRRNGRVLVPDMLSYSTSRLTVDIQDLPLDRTLAEAAHDIKLAPGGALVTLARPAPRALTFRLQLESGEPVPAGAQLSVDGATADLPVANDGLVYLETTAAQLTLRAHWGKNQCETQRVDTNAPTGVILCRLVP